MSAKRVVNAAVRYPFTTYVAFGIILYSVVYFAGIAYDEGGARGALYWGSHVFGVVFWIVDEIAFRLNAGKAVPGHDVLVPAVSVVVALLLDRGIARLRRSRAHGRN